MASVGQELLNVPFGEMITEMALAIAEGQHALDMNSIEVAQILAETNLPADSVVLAIKQAVDDEGNPKGPAEPVYNKFEMNLLTYGLEPRFYEFTESIIEVRMAISMKVEKAVSKEYDREYNYKRKKKTASSIGTGGLFSFLFAKAQSNSKTTTTTAYSSTYNAKYSSKYTFKETGTSLLRTTLRPVPPPDRAIPTYNTIVPPTPT